MTILNEKSAFAPVDADQDGLRIMATRFWPRGVKKETADLYLPDLAPSKDLLRAFKAGDIAFPEFTKRYKSEMKNQTSLLRMLHWLDARGETMTVLCVCDSVDHCHRSILPDLIRKAN